MNATLNSDLHLGCKDGEDVLVITSATLLGYNALIFFLGVPGNSLVLGVYWGKTHKSTTDILIQGLAMVDLAVCLLRLFSVGHHFACLAGVTVPDVLRDTFTLLDRVWVGMCVLVTALIAFDRYDCVCRPKCRFMTTTRTKAALACVFAVVLCGYIPLHLFEIARDDDSTNLEVLPTVFLRVAAFVVALFMVSACYSKVFLTIRRHVRIRSISISGSRGGSTRHHLPAVATVSALVTTKQAFISKRPDQIPGRETVNNLKHAPAWSASASNRNTCNNRQLHSRQEGPGVEIQPARPVNQTSVLAATESGGRAVPPVNPLRRPQFKRRRSHSSVLQRRTTIMLFVTSLVFLLSWLPYWVIILMRFFGVNYSAVVDVSIKLIYLNNAANPFIYGVANRRFRRECRNVLCRMRR